MPIFRSTSSGLSGATVLMAEILSSSPQTRLHDDRSTVFLIMPATLSKASAAVAAVDAVAAVLSMRLRRGRELLSGVFASGKRDPAATISIVEHAEAMKRPLQRHFSGRAETSRAAVHAAGGYFQAHAAIFRGHC